MAKVTKKKKSRKSPKRKAVKRKKLSTAKRLNYKATNPKTVLSRLERDGFYLDAAGKVTAGNDLYMAQ